MIGERIRQHRKRLGLTQDQLAARLGTRGGDVSYWESGKNKPRVDYIVKLAELFGVSCDWLMRGPSAVGLPRGSWGQLPPPERGPVPVVFGVSR